MHEYVHRSRRGRGSLSHWETQNRSLSELGKSFNETEWQGGDIYLVYLFLWDRKNKCKYDPPVYKLVVCTRDIISCCAVVLAQHFGQTTRFPRQPRKAWLRARQYAIWGSQLFSPQAQKTVFVEDFTVFQICLWRGKILSPLFKLAAGAIFFGPFFYSPVVEQENKGFDPNTSLFEVREAFQRTLLLGFRAFIRAYPAMFWPPSGGP